jgi:hypothetical protein
MNSKTDKEITEEDITENEILYILKHNFGMPKPQLAKLLMPVIESSRQQTAMEIFDLLQVEDGIGFNWTELQRIKKKYLGEVEK